jgi:hypothetical protein
MPLPGQRGEIRNLGAGQIQLLQGGEQHQRRQIAHRSVVTLHRLGSFFHLLVAKQDRGVSDFDVQIGAPQRFRPVAHDRVEHELPQGGDLPELHQIGPLGADQVEFSQALMLAERSEVFDLRILQLQLLQVRQWF